MAKSPSGKPVVAKTRRATAAIAQPVVAHPARRSAAPAVNFADENARLVHELQVHQIELETQNRELREAQQLLEISRDRYADLVDFAHVGYVTLDKQEIIRELNLTAAGLLGEDRLRLVGTPFRQHVVPEDRAGFREHLRALTAPDQHATAELHLVRKHRPAVPVLLQTTLEAGTEAGSRRYCTTLTDLTARQQAEAALRAQEALLRSITDHAEDIMAVKDREGRYLFMNPAGCRTTGYSPAQLLGRTDLELHPDRDQARRFMADDRRVMESGRREMIEEQFAAHSGERCVLLTTKVPRRDAQGRVVGVIVVCRDITERQRAEAALRESEGRLQTVIENLAEGLVIADSDGQLLYWNPASLEMWGFASSAECLRRLPEFAQVFELTTLAGVVVPLEQWPMSRVLRGETLRDYELRVRRLDTGVERICSYAGAPVRDSTGRQLGFISITDITARQQVEHALRDSEERFRQVVENIDEVFWMSDVAKNEMLFISAGYERIWGQSRASLYAAPRRWLAAIHPQDRARVLQAALLKQTRGDYDEEYRIVRPDGTQRWIHDRAFPIRDAAGKVYRVAGVAEDITARKRAEQRRHLQYETARLLAAGESPAETMAKLLQAVATTVGWGVGQFWEMTGTSKQLRAVQVWHAPGRQLDAYVKHLLTLTFSIADGLPGRVLASGRAEWIAEISRHPDFRLKREAARAGLRTALAFPILLREQPLGVMAFLASEMAEPDADLLRLFASLGSQIGQFMERRKAEEALREAHEFSKQVVDGAAAGIIVYDREGRFVVWNPFMEQLTGFRAAEFLGRRTVEVLPFLGEVHFRKMFQRALAGEVFEAADIPFDLPAAGKQGWLAARFAPWRDVRREIVGVIVTVRDITERRQLEAELLEIADREQRRIGHDLHDGLGQQLTALEMKCFLLQEDLAAADLAARRDTLQAQTRQISQALQECITVTRSLAHGLAPSVLTTDGLVGALERLAVDTRVPGILECRLVNDGPVTIVDPQIAKHLYRIAQEAVNNVLKHARARRIEIHLTHAPGALHLQIRDDGRGLPKRRKARPGMGLEVMRHRAQVIGASLEIASSPGRGVTVTCTLPLKES